MKRTVTVLQDDIDHGRRGSFRKCAVARALCRDLADLADQRLDSPGTTVTVGDLCLTINGYVVGIPGPVTEFIHRFDNGFPVEPFKFEIEVPQ